MSTENQEGCKIQVPQVISATEYGPDRKYEVQWGRFVQFMKDEGLDDPLDWESTRRQSRARRIIALGRTTSRSPWRHTRVASASWAVL